MYKTILLPLDGSPLAEQALQHAVALAECFHSKLIILKVLVPLNNNLSLPPGAVKRAEAATRELVNEYLNRVASRVQDKGFPITTITVTGRPHEEIIHFAEMEQVDIVVMCTRGQSGISRWLMGSVADRVVRSVNVPVFLIHAATGSHDGE